MQGVSREEGGEEGGRENEGKRTLTGARLGIFTSGWRYFILLASWKYFLRLCVHTHIHNEQCQCTHVCCELTHDIVY